MKYKKVFLPFLFFILLIIPCFSSPQEKNTSQKLRPLELSDILGWKSLIDTGKRKKQVERILKRLKKESYITGWNRVKNTMGLKTVWFIWGIDTIRQEQKAIEVEPDIMRNGGIEKDKLEK